MPKIQVVLSDADRDAFVSEARREGVGLSEWLRAAARDRLQRSRAQKRFTSAEDVRAFFAACDAQREDGKEPEWEQHLGVIRESRARGQSRT